MLSRRIAAISLSTAKSSFFVNLSPLYHKALFYPIYLFRGFSYAGGHRVFKGRFFLARRPRWRSSWTRLPKNLPVQRPQGPPPPTDKDVGLFQVMLRYQ